MTVSNVTSTANPYVANDTQSSFRKDFRTLAKDLKSGDLAGAQDAWAALQQDSPDFAKVLAGATTANQASSSQSANATTTALQSLQSALQSGDLSAAQTAFSSLTQALQSSQPVPHHHHHHHHHDDQNQSNSTSVPATSGTTNDSSNTKSSGGTVNTLA